MRLLPDRIGLRTALVAIVLGGIVASATALHLAWWRTATSVSRELVGTLESQITQTVRRQWWAVVGEVERMSQGMRDLLDASWSGLPPERIMLAASRPSPTLSWLLLVPPEGEVIALESLGDKALRLLRAGPDGVARAMGTVLRPHAEPGGAATPAPAAPAGPRRVLARHRRGFRESVVGRRGAHAGWRGQGGGLRRQGGSGAARRHDEL